MIRMKLIGGVGAAALTIVAVSQWTAPPTKAVAPVPRTIVAAPVISAPIVAAAPVPTAPTIKPLALLPAPVCEPTLVKAEPVKTVAKPRAVRQYRRIRYGYYKHRRRSYYR